MTTVKDFAEAYEPKKTKNIVELEAVSVSQEIKEEVRKDKNGDDYNINVMNVLGEEYRVPNSVVEQIQAILLVKPNMKTFKVTKKGEGLNTVYTVIQLE